MNDRRMNVENTYDLDGSITSERANFIMKVYGLLTLSLAHGDAAFSPWAMGVPFGVGQLFAAGVLYRTLERHDESR